MKKWQSKNGEHPRHLFYIENGLLAHNSMGMGWHYRRSYETILVGQKPGAACKWYDETDKIENIIRPGYKGIRKIIPTKNDHPTPKPVELAKHFIGLHTQKNDTVLDPFCGRGWVGEACYQMGRKFIGFEIDKEHFDKAVEKFELLAASTPLFDYLENTPSFNQPELFN